MKRKRLFIILTILSIVILGVGGTFAYYTTSAVATNITQIKAGNLTMTVDGGGNTNASFMPAKCTSEYAIKKKIVATSTNTSGGKVSFSIGMNIATLSDSLKRESMRYTLTTNASSCTGGIISSGSFKNKTVGSDVWLIKNDYDNITKSGNNYTKTYYLYIWLDETETQNLSGSISVNMKGTSSNNPSLTTEANISLGVPGTLYYEMESNADKTTAVNFSQTSDENRTNGIYMTKDTDSGIPVYYYRGNVDNKIIFANFCWRIVRTTETGGVKLIYDGKPSNGQCNSAGANSQITISAFNSASNDAKYVGYMYGSSIDDTVNTTDSTIKTAIDNWYKTNMTSYTSKLEDTVFCNDRSYTMNGSYLYFGAYARLGVNKTPTLKCQNTRDKFTTETINGNGNLTYPVGLITADEIAFAGGLLQKDNQFYLGSGMWYYSMSPYDFTGTIDDELYLSSNGTLFGSNGNVSDSGGTRPVISIKPETIISGGSGTTTDPFIVE